MQSSGASLLIELLKRQGIGIVAGIPGGANLPLYDALGQSDLRHILVRHEQAGGFLAQGMARSTGSAAACFATRARERSTCSPPSPMQSWIRFRSSPSRDRSRPA